MKTGSEQRARLARMEAARVETERHLAIIERQIAARAERITISTHIKTRHFGHATSRWSPVDERQFQETLAALRFERRVEIDALASKLARQSSALAAFRLRHGISAAPEEMTS